MKKFLALMAAAAAALTFTPTDIRAGDCHRSRIHSRCGSCGHPILAYYRPVRTVTTRTIYGWVPSYHRHCGVKLHASVYGHRHVPGDSNLRHRYGSPNHHNFGYQSGVVRRSVPAAGIHRHYPSGRTLSTYPGWRYRSLSRCR